MGNKRFSKQQLNVSNSQLKTAAVKNEKNFWSRFFWSTQCSNLGTKCVCFYFLSL